jgi:hypothetical protein
LDNKSGFLTRRPVFVRSVYAEDLLENFFVSAIASVLAVRFYLNITGFPQLGTGSMHIAHMLWGGLLMLAALITLLAFLDSRAKSIAAVLGGIGFGVFIDELGKFVTRDNDYLFQPTVALIYVIFILIFFAIRTITKRQSLTSRECLANAFEIAKEGSLDGLDQDEQANVLRLMENCGSSPAGQKLGTILDSMNVMPEASPRLLDRAHAMLDRYYRWATSKWWFSGIIVAFFAITAVTAVFAVVAVVEWTLGLTLWVTVGIISLIALVWSRSVGKRRLNIVVYASIVAISILLSWAIVTNLKGRPVSVIEWAQFIFPGISGLLIIVGILALPRSRLEAYQMFRWSILVSIFFTQVVLFYEQQFLALTGLVLNVLILNALRYMIRQEEIKH